MKVFSKKTGELSLFDSFPGPYPANLYLPGSTLRATHSDECSFIFQEFDMREFRLRFSNISSKKETQYVVMDEGMITLRISLYRSHIYNLQDLGQQVYHERNYNLFYVPAYYSEGSLHSNTLFSFVDIILSRDYLQIFEKEFPQLADFLVKADHKMPAKLCAHNQVAPTEIMHLLDEILNWAGHTEKEITILYYYVSELLRHCLTKAKNCPVKRTSKMKLADIEKIYKLGELLEERGKDIDLKELAGKLHSSIYMLNKGFKEIYGFPLQQFPFEENMRKALLLVKDESYSIKQIAGMTGYKDPQSFIRAFKRRFGYTPRRNFKKKVATLN